MNFLIMISMFLLVAISLTSETEMFGLNISILRNAIRNVIGILNTIHMFVLNFSFDASLVMYINRTSIPPIIIRNKI